MSQVKSKLSILQRKIKFKHFAKSASTKQIKNEKERKQERKKTDRQTDRYKDRQKAIKQARRVNGPEVRHPLG